MRYWLKYGHYQREGMFTKIRGGYRMIGWESEIDLCRAYGRGWRGGTRYGIHPYDNVSPLMIQVNGRWHSAPR